jgi:arsenate reductase-like glutaredoxin family protein
MSLTGAANPSGNEKSTVDKICQQLTQGTRSLTKTQAAVKRMDPHRKTENKKLCSLRAALSHDQGENDCEELRNEKSQRKTTLNTNTATTSTTITKAIMNSTTGIQKSIFYCNPNKIRTAMESPPSLPHLFRK